MAFKTSQLHSLSNPLATIEQLSTSSSQLDGVPANLESSLHYAGALLTQAAGILLRLPQENIAQAIVLFQRFYTGPEGGSLRINAVQDISAASLYLTAKPSSHPLAPRTLLTIHTYLLSPASPLRHPSISPSPFASEYHHLSEPTYQHLRTRLFSTESLILRTTAYTPPPTLPYHLALTYLQTLSALPTPPTTISAALAARTLSNLNTALLSPQLLYLTHQPHALAVAAIYLAAREVGVRLPRCEWWEVFDVEREELGFLVVGMGSCARWVEGERERWVSGGPPLGLEELEREIEGRGG
ncbi:hypothetical protein MMC21_005941 [Puttea exsequens]|nr:hypothetical protein [Puttea exsequens]